ncbi:MAG: hypothetical protein AB7V56_01575 [Candidatus Nitrosocosmicus sp.]|jgi:hypothetical protein|uniref:hypothetical protein n=1 Tax=Candidatus Nitrosocosmicus agrestis TaxID=2563600 RepID=UPI00122E419E|nr:hypothetical protein [Candidatus Nitrosocosmicus sp. SS]KAA2282020.1 hypothetical protein F1Z66_07660 [Candidatus Nitrosocosmicus sp. SS]KAF0869925.1 hypothetical protein E5N71_02935 [Candidatus Nitrosocosmicus sp. SS]MDR4490725.1 hypothetical protein [Candidatus Nitrosocosmicus sp.]HET8794667.1 hypothetical protein [Nitrososphaeraceae archaeon]
MSGDTVNDKASSNIYYYLPGKWEKSPPNKHQNKEIDTSSGQDNNASLDICYNHLDFDNVSEYLQSIDIDLKNLHRKWSNMD